VRELVVARHAESRLNIDDVLNGDPSVSVGLTSRGREQARALGETVGSVELVAHTSFHRTRETAVLAWPGTPRLVVPDLDEIRFGSWEGTRWSDGYAEWVRVSGPEEPCPGGGESRLDAAQRYLSGFELLLRRPEDSVALVAHQAQVRYLLLASAGTPPTRVLEHVPAAEPYTIDRRGLERAVEVLSEWTGSPVF
jgi:broad specificity phosphatase PhoE